MLFPLLATRKRISKGTPIFENHAMIAKNYAYLFIIMQYSYDEAKPGVLTTHAFCSAAPIVIEFPLIYYFSNYYAFKSLPLTRN